MGRSLRAKLTAALVGVAAAAVVVTALVSVSSLRAYARTNALDDLRRIARGLATDAEIVGRRAGANVNFVRRVLRVNGDVLSVAFADGRGMGESPEINALAGMLNAALAGGRSQSGDWSAGGADYVYVAVPVGNAEIPLRLRREGVVGVVLARPVDLTREIVGPLVRRVVLAAVVALAAAFVAAALLARWLSRPVRALSEAAARVARGDLSRRVPASRTDEVGDLARTFNDMSEALAESQRREREFLATVSHELKTPLTAIRGYVEALEDGALKGDAERARALGVIRAETDRLERMVQDVMDLARLGAREFSLEVRRCDLADTLRDAVEAHRAQAADAGLALRPEIPAPLPAETDPDRVRQIVGNLVENAMRVTSSGGTIEVRGSERGGAVAIEVSDTGPGIAAADLPHVFERSYLWRASRGSRPVGTGLGLAIVRELVDALGGRIAVRSDGAGTTFRIELPSRARASHA